MTEKTVSIKLYDIRTDGMTQSRVALDKAYVAELAERDLSTLPPVTVFYDGTTYWLADGFHRFEAHRAKSAFTIPCEVLQGTHRDAVRYSCGANKVHGLRRSNADKRNAVLTMLGDSEWSQLSDRKIADELGVSHTFVAGLRPGLATLPPPPPSSTSTNEQSAPPPAPSETGPPEQRAPAATKPVKDGAGRVTREHAVVTALDEAPKFKAVANEIRAAKRNAIALAATPIGANIRSQQVERDLENAAKGVLFGTPFAACPFPAATCDQGNCKACQGRRWVTKEVWDRISDAVKEATA